jgi:hypothetical protein
VKKESIFHLRAAPLTFHSAAPAQTSAPEVLLITPSQAPSTTTTTTITDELSWSRTKKTTPNDSHEQQNITQLRQPELRH